MTKCFFVGERFCSKLELCGAVLCGSFRVFHQCNSLVWVTALASFCFSRSCFVFFFHLSLLLLCLLFFIFHFVFMFSNLFSKSKIFLPGRPSTRLHILLISSCFHFLFLQKCVFTSSSCVCLLCFMSLFLMCSVLGCPLFLLLCVGTVWENEK